MAMQRSEFIPYVNAEMIQRARAGGASPVEVSMLYLIRGVDEIVQGQTFFAEENKRRAKITAGLEKKLEEKNKLIKELLKQVATMTKTLNKLGRAVQGKHWDEVRPEADF